MRILLSNDDGVLAPGLNALANALKTIADVTVVAPESERSGFSSALTLDRPLRPLRLSNGFWSVNGTPADCVYLAVNGFFDQEPDMVISGINSGANLGDDVLRRIAVWKLEGWTGAEMATELGITRRSVERKLERIRELWKGELN